MKKTRKKKRVVHRKRGKRFQFQFPDWLKVFSLMFLFWGAFSVVIYSQIKESRNEFKTEIKEVKTDLKELIKQNKVDADTGTETAIETMMSLYEDVKTLKNENKIINMRIEKLEEKTKRIIP